MSCEKVYTMETSHSPFFSRPKELVDILCDTHKPVRRNLIYLYKMDLFSMKN
jgi:hypothetical protein